MRLRDFPYCWQEVGWTCMRTSSNVEVQKVHIDNLINNVHERYATYKFGIN
jgi:hypothetical protein